MTDSLRPLRIRLVDPGRVGELLEFLRQRNCVAEQVSSVGIDVWPPPLLHEHDTRGADHSPGLAAYGALACAACGGPVEEALGRLGSPRCHDCRDEEHQRGTLGASANGDGRRRLDRARVELQAYLRAWRASNGGAAAALADD